MEIVSLHFLLFLAPNSGPVPSMKIYGFTTNQLFKALTKKAQDDTNKLNVADQIPDLLERFHREMANDVFHVSFIHG